MRLAAVSLGARKLGLLPGLTLADARARIPYLNVIDRDPQADAVLLQKLGEDCDRFSPAVVIDVPDGLTLDITGCAHLFGDESELRKIILNRLRRSGFHARGVIAGAADAARALARYGRRVPVLPPGEDEAAVRALPIAALGLDDDTRIAISRAGLKTIGAIADRPSMAFAARFGAAMTLHLSRVLGREDAPFSPLRPVPMLWVERCFPEPIGRTEDIEAVLVELGAEAAEKLGQNREGGRAFEASFYRADGAVRRIGIETGRPMRDPKTMLRLFREKLDALTDPIDPGFGFDLIRLAVPVTEALDAVQTGLDGHAIAENEIADLADRLSTRFGQDRVLRFVSENTHDPERAAKAVSASFNPLTSLVWPTPKEQEPPLRPVQIFDPPQLVDASAQVPDGPPLHFNWRRRKHVVVHAEGPERIAPEWWRAPDASERDYYRVEDIEGRRFWLFRSGAYGDAAGAPRWYVHGLFA